MDDAKIFVDRLSGRSSGTRVACGRRTARAQVIDRELRERVAQKFTIAIGGFAPFPVNGEDFGKLGASVLSNDLKFTTVFDVMEGAHRCRSIPPRSSRIRSASRCPVWPR